MARPRYDYELGSDINTMTNVWGMGSGTLSPHERVEPMGKQLRPFSTYAIAVSGMQYGDGYSWTKWHFDAIHEDQLEEMESYVGDGNQSAAVGVRTRKEDGTFAPFTAIMHKPKQSEGEKTPTFNNMWTGVDILFTMLEEQAEP